MRKDARQLRFGPNGLDKTAGDIDETAWQREGVDPSVIQDFEFVGIFVRRSVDGKLAPKRLDVRIGVRVANKGHCAFGFQRQVASHLNVLLHGKHIPARLQAGSICQCWQYQQA
jgi:hypothetical protein